MLSLFLLIAGAIVVMIVGSGLFWLIVQLVVIVREAQRPPHQDAGGYSIDQGQDVADRER